jgi:HD-GYP domain-containing protein (c-di-GMP phosphodiesterase class II)
VNDAQRRQPLLEVSDLIAAGVPLPFQVLDAQGRLLLAEGQVIASARQLDALFERGACVVWAEAEAVRQARAQAAAAGAPRPSAKRDPTLFDGWEQHLWALDTLLRTMGRDPAQRAAIEARADVHMALVDRHPDAALFLCVRQDDRRFALYGLAHALHTATVVQLTGRVFGLPPERVRTLVRAALTMNASIVELQARMAEQTDPPGKRQMDEIRAHPLASAQQLRDGGIIDAEWLALVEHHHEQTGGGGYPHGLEQVDDLARLLRAADVFMAKISPRALRAPLLPQMAARQLFQEEAGSPLAAALIKAVGVYPPGDFVRLRNGDLAVVTHRATTGAAVQAVAVLDARGKPVTQSPQRDTGVADHAIVGPVTERAGLPRVLPEQVYGLVPP